MVIPKANKASTRQKMAELAAAIKKVTMGDFSGAVNVPDKENELSEIFSLVNQMLDSLRQFRATQEETEGELKDRIFEFEQWRKTAVGRELKMVELKDAITSLQTEIADLKKSADNLTPEEEMEVPKPPIGKDQTE